MATSYEFIYRGDEIQIVEEYFNHPDPAVRGDRYRWALDRLGGDEGLLLEFLDGGGDLSELETRLVEGDSVDHYRRHWLGRDDDGFWPDRDGAEIGQTLRDGFRAAIEQALELDLPLSIVQVNAGDTLQIGHLPAPTCVLVVLATPATEARAAE